MQKTNVNGLEGAKYFFPVERGKFFLAPLYCENSPGNTQVQKYFACMYSKIEICPFRGVNIVSLSTVCINVYVYIPDIICLLGP